MECAFLLYTLLLLSGAGLWKRADSAKVTCKVCKDFVVSFNKVRGGQWVSVTMEGVIINAFSK